MWIHTDRVPPVLSPGVGGHRWSGRPAAAQVLQTWTASPLARVDGRGEPASGLSHIIQSPLHPDPRLLTLSFYCPSFPSEPVSLPHHGLTTTRVLHLFRKACTPASLISGVQSVTSTFHAYSSGRTKITPSTFLGMSVVTKQFRAFQFVLTYCDCIGLTLSLTPVCTSNVCLICAIIIITTTWSSFCRTNNREAKSTNFFFLPRVPTRALGEKKKSDRSRCYDEQKSKQL